MHTVVDVVDALFGEIMMMTLFLTYYSAFLELSVVVSRWRAIMIGIDEFILIDVRFFVWFLQQEEDDDNIV